MTSVAGVIQKRAADVRDVKRTDHFGYVQTDLIDGLTHSGLTAAYRFTGRKKN